MRSKNTIIALVAAIVLAIISYVVLAFVGLSGERGMGQPVTGGFYLQDSATEVMDDLTSVYNLVTYIISGIVAFVLGVTVKAVGNTWNWSYIYPDHENVDEIISNPLDKTQAKAQGKPYLLGTDAALVVPVDTNVKVLVTSVNNMHAWTVPSFGIKMDAVPGIINETWFRANREGTFYGQCSEICGIKHYYMPIEVKVVSKAEYAKWIANDGAFTTSVADNNLGSGQTAAQK